MPDIPRYRSEVTGHFVQFFSRNPKTTTLRWLRDSRPNTARAGMHGAAKTNYEASGKILWPDDIRASEGKPEATTQRQRHQQQELHPWCEPYT
jgi:hypothetical protein